MGQINLLPLDLRQRQEVSFRRLLTKGFVLIAAVGLIGGSVSLTFLVYSTQRQLVEVQEQLARLQPTVIQVQKVQREITAKEQEASRLQAVFNERLLWGTILDNLNDRLPKDLWLTKLSADEAGKFNLQGMATSLTSIGIFQYQLNQLKELSWVSLKSAEEVVVGDNALIKFEILGQLSKGGGV